MRTPSTTGLMLCALLALAAAATSALGAAVRDEADGSKAAPKAVEDKRGYRYLKEAMLGGQDGNYDNGFLVRKKGYAYLNSVLRNYRDFDYAYRR
ncbi:hypothetical protein BOX15_Mlig027719g1 [Macrostomum lignano]|nr:hypothetical protein BOX15_Mlig027719g2 [Macrostomum lignano]PAA80049.1 hypothetical protein BOX15_Mlig027719g1 [Macrostomum lignano]